MTERERDTLPPTPASAEELLREVLAAVQGTRADFHTVTANLAAKVDNLAASTATLTAKVYELAEASRDTNLSVLGLDTRLGMVEDQIKRYANEQIALAARVTVLEHHRTPFTPRMEDLLLRIVERFEANSK